MMLLPKTGETTGKTLPIIVAHDRCVAEAVTPGAELPVQEPRELHLPAVSASTSTVFAAKGTLRAGEKGLFFFPPFSLLSMPPLIANDYQ